MVLFGVPKNRVGALCMYVCVTGFIFFVDKMIRWTVVVRATRKTFGELPPPASCDKLVQMDLKLKPEFVGHKIRRRPHPAPKEQAEEVERQIQECIDAGLVLEYRDGDYPQHCGPCFLVGKPGSEAKRLAVDYGELNKKMLNHLVHGVFHPHGE